MQRHAFGLLRRRPGFDSRQDVWAGVSVPHTCMYWLEVPLEQGESPSALVLIDMVLNPQPASEHLQITLGVIPVFWEWLTNYVKYDPTIKPRDCLLEPLI